MSKKDGYYVFKLITSDNNVTYVEGPINSVLFKDLENEIVYNEYKKEYKFRDKHKDLNKTYLITQYFAFWMLGLEVEKVKTMLNNIESEE
jgi:hypothetical protein